MLPYICSVITDDVKMWYECVWLTDVQITTFWPYLLSITEQTHDIMEFACFVCYME